MDRPAGGRPGTGGGDQGPRDERPPAAHLLGLPVARGGRRHVGERPHRAAVHLDLVGGLVRPGAAQGRRPVRGEDDERQAGVVGLEHRRVQVGHRGAAGRHDGDRLPRAPGQAEGEEAGGPLVDPGVQGERAVGGRRVHGEGERRRAGAGTEHHVPDPAPHQLVDDGPGERGRAVGRRGGGGHGSESCRIAASRAAQCAVRSGVAASRSSAAPSTSGRTTGSDPSSGSSGPDRHVVGEELDGGEPAGVGQLGEGRGEGDPGGDPDAGLQRAADHDREADVLGDPQARADPAERLHLEHRDVGRVELPDPVGVGGPPDRLVGGDRDRDPAPHLGELLDGRRTAARRTPALRPPGRAAAPPAPPRRPTSRRWRRPGPGRPAPGRPGPPRAVPRPRRRPGPARRP